MAVRIYVVVVVIIAFLHLSYADLPTGCNGKTDVCPDNSKCDTDKCVCEDDFKLNTDADGCIAKVIGGACTADKDCTTVHNSMCKADAPRTCICKDAFKHQESDDTCVAKEKVSEVDCTKGTADQCTQIPNAECNNAETGAKCQCSSGYKENSNDGSKCVLQTVIDVDCSANGKECDNIANAECGTDKCKCSPNFVMNVGKCVPENAGAFIEVGILTIVLSVLSTVQMVVR